MRHPLEEGDSWRAYVSRHPEHAGADDFSDAPSSGINIDQDGEQQLQQQRRLHRRSNKAKARKHDADGDDEFDPVEVENIKFQEDVRSQLKEQKAADKKRRKAEKKRRKRFKELYRYSGIAKKSVHGLMIDAGSTGSRMHVYEFKPRVLKDKTDVAAAVSGKKLSFPGTESRWTERLRPGISDFAHIEDDQELEKAIAKYLEPLISFAKSILHEKEEDFGSFPIFLKATAGLRTIPSKNRHRVINTVRKLFANETYCPFWDEKERVRVISGEEEAAYGWTAVNFLLGDLMKNSEGVGEAYGGAIQTYGALDMGGASAQISFYQPDGDIMSGLFKLQVGQGKHWNVYAHSHLMFGVNMAEARRKARLVMDKPAIERLVEGVYDPCLPGKGRLEFKSTVHFDANGVETWDASFDDFATPSNTNETIADDGLYHAILVNNKKTGDWTKCKALAREVLNEKSNTWCKFSYLGSCSVAGVYQPELPTQEAASSEFLAFSNYYHVWQFLKMQPRSSIDTLEKRGAEVCSQSWDDLVEYNANNPNITLDEDELATYCFRAAYVHEMLRHGYGFKSDDHVTATNVLNGQKVGWSLGSILYEINTLPWDYVQSNYFAGFMVAVFVMSLLGLLQIIRLHHQRSKVRNRWKEGYEAVMDMNDIEIEKLARSCPDLKVRHLNA